MLKKEKAKEMVEEDMTDVNENLDEEKVDITDEVNKDASEEAAEGEAETEETKNSTDNIKEKLMEQENLAKDYLDKLQRTMAEYDNFRKRTIKEKSLMYENGAREVLEKILPVIDNFQRAINSIKEEEKETSLAQGIEMIYKQLIGCMKDIGVEEIDAVGKEFDPNLHHAVAHEENEAYGSNEVIESLQSGYMYKERVLRCSMVKVAN